MKPEEQILAKQEIVDLLRDIAEHLAAIRRSQGLSPGEWLTVQEVAKELCVARDTIERLIASGRLKATVVGTGRGKGLRHRYRVRQEWLEEYLKANIQSERCAEPPARPRQKHRPSVDFIGD